MYIHIYIYIYIYISSALLIAVAPSSSILLLPRQILVRNTLALRPWLCPTHHELSISIRHHQRAVCCPCFHGTAWYLVASKIDMTDL